MDDMVQRKKRSTVLAIVIMLAATMCQVVGLVRYSNRLPDDWLGVTLYAVTIVGLLAVAGMLAFGQRGPE
jgi:undecaprenyl pyrophosphate phosphatase UppP